MCRFPITPWFLPQKRLQLHVNFAKPCLFFLPAVPLLCHAPCLRGIIPSGIARQHAHQTPTTHRYLLVTKRIPSPHLPQRHRQVRCSDAEPTTKYHILIPNRPTNQASIQTATATVTAASENIKPTALHTTHDTRHTSLNPFLSCVSIYCH